MIQRLTVAVAVFGILIASVGYFAYTAWQARMALNGEFEPVTLSAEQVAENRERLTQVLVSNAGVSLPDVLRGFWYRYIDENGIEQIAFLNVNELAEKDVTAWQVGNIAKIVKGSQVLPRDTMQVVSVADMPDEYRFHNQLYKVNKDDDFIKGKEELEKRIASGEYSQEDLFKLGYIYEIEGKYALRDALNARGCAEFNYRCDKALSVIIGGRVVDMDGMPLQSATVSVLSADGLSTKTDEHGEYKLAISVRKMEKVRIKAHKRNFSDGIANTVVVTSGKKKYMMDEISLASPLKIITLNNTLDTITGDANSYNDGVFTIQTPQSVYKIAKNSIVHENGDAYLGEMEVYLYEFTRDTAPESLLAVDTIDSVVGYAGDLMKSFGMPYIQFFTPEGEELHVLKSNPMEIRYTIYHMNELYNNTDGIYTALTKENMEQLVFASLGGNYPIDREYLIRNNLLQFPAFWVFDRSVGVWENVGINVITADGLIESIFYTINDGR